MPLQNILKYLQLQTVDPTNDGTTSALDEYEHDEILDLSADIDENVLDQAWGAVIDDLDSDNDRINFSEE
jgi:hypothetical protein